MRAAETSEKETQPRPPHTPPHPTPPTPSSLHSHLFRDPHALPHEAPGLPQAAVQLLSSRFARRTSRLALDPPLTSRDGSTTKMLLRLARDGAEVEAVIMRYDTSVVRRAGGGNGGGEGGEDGEEEEEEQDEDENENERMAAAATTTTSPLPRRRESGGRRATLCVSSQVGCAMGCTFCATGTMGKLRSLSAAEILEQADFALEVLSRSSSDSSSLKSSPLSPSSPPPDSTSEAPWRLRNVVMMGMGEPLDAYPSVVKAVRCLTSNARFGLRRSAVTVSTVGVVPRIRSLAKDLPGISLALSLHAPTQELRQRIVPSARAWPLDKLLAAVDDYQKESGQRVFIEYVLLKSVNDSVECGLLLGELLAGRDVVVNLIPWNPVEAVLEKKEGAGGGEEEKSKSKNNLIPPETFAAPGTAAVDAFVEAVRSSSAASSKGDGKRLPVTVRAEKGQDIAGACGQLVVAKKKLESEGGGGGGGGGKEEESGKSCFSSPAAGACCSSDAPPATPARDIEELAGGARGGAGRGSSSGRAAAVKAGGEAAAAAAAPLSSGISGVAGTFASWLGFR